MINNRITTFFGRFFLGLSIVLFTFLCFGIQFAGAGERIVKVGVYENAPKVFTSESGQPAGIFIDIIEYIAKSEGWNIHYVPGTWSEGLGRLEKGEIDLMPDVAYTKEREKIFSFHKESVLFSWCQVYAYEDSGIQTILDLKGKKIAVLERSIQQEVFFQLNKSFELNTTIIGGPDYKTIFEMVEKNEVDAVVTNRFYGLMHAKEYGLEDTAVIFYPSNLFFAATKNDPKQLLDRIDKHLLNLKRDSQSVYYGSLKRWLSEEVRFEFPVWLKTIIIALGVVLFIGLVGSVVLKRQVMRRTVQLRQQLEERKQIEEDLRNTRDYLDNLFNYANAPIIAWDTEGKITRFNHAFEYMTGLLADEVIGQELSILFPESSRDESLGKIQDTLRGEYWESVEIPILRKDGNERIALWNSANIYAEDGVTVIATIAQGMDITERQHMQENLRKSEEFNKRIIENSTDCIKILDLDGRLEFMSPGGQELLEIEDIGPYLNQSWIDFWKGSDRTAALETISRAKKGDAGRFRGYCPTEKGTEKWWGTIITPIVGKDGKVEQLLAVSRDITKHRKADEALRESEEKYRLVLENAYDAIFIGQDEVVKFPNPKTQEMSGYSAEELAKLPFISLVHPEDKDMVLDRYMRWMKGEEPPATFDFRIINKAGEELWVELNTTAVSWDERPATLNILRDTTQQKKLEARFLQAQKMEAIGTLAGGVAHDFNNLLTAILGYAELSLMGLGKDNPVREEIEEIKKAGNSAASLIRQLLAFSRKQIVQPKIVDLNEFLSGMEKMLGRLLGEDVELLAIPEPALWQVEADPGQMEQVIMNLAVNARDAMPMGGKLTIETANMDLDENYFREHGIREEQPGSYVVIAVSDTGSGMDKETQEHIFEPFFTTKEIDKGTGLGLSTVYGIVKQNNGFIWVYSEPGQGTTFKVYLPKVKGDVEAVEKERTPVVKLDGSETVLIVEDDDGLRKLAQKSLQQHGYRVLAAENGEDALKVSEAHDGSIDLLITDVVMPKMSGKETVERLQPLYPQMKVIYMSGYTDNAIAHHGILAPGLNFLEKPFSPKGLARKVREVLDK